MLLKQVTSTQNASEAEDIVRATDGSGKGTCLESFFAMKNKISWLVMMDHLAQESGAGSVFAEMHTLRAIREMCRCGDLGLCAAGNGQRFALNAHQVVLVPLLHGAISRSVRQY